MAGRGRPYTIADLEPETVSISVVNRFYGIVDTLTYRETRALANALGLKYKTIHNIYRGRYRFPGLGTAYRVIDWDERGRPLLEIKQPDVNISGV